MKTKEKKSKHGGLLLTCLLILGALISKTSVAAQTTSPPETEQGSQNYISFWIIGTILGIGIIGFIIVSKREKKQKLEDDHLNIKHISHHRHHHHHRVIKKSA